MAAERRRSCSPAAGAPLARWQLAGRRSTASPPKLPSSLTFNSIPHVVMMATPRDLEDMGVGFTVSEALAELRRDPRGGPGSFLRRTSNCALSVTGSRLGERAAAPPQPHRPHRLRRLRRRDHRGCNPSPAAGGRGRRDLPRAAGAGAACACASCSRLGAQAGSLHAAAWVGWDGEVRLVREDVGRHNALDKLIGAKLRGGRILRRGLRAGDQPRELRDGPEGRDAGHPHAGGGFGAHGAGREAGARTAA